MKKIILIALFAMVYVTAFSQTYTFSNTTDYAIPDNDSYVNDGFVHGAMSDITVSGIPCTAEIDHITLNIDHTFDGDLTIYLLFYDERVILSQEHGGGGEDYTNTTFSNSATSPISGESAPFTGTFIPDQPILVFNDIANPNAKWTLQVCDGYNNDTGTLLDWEIVLKPRACPVQPSLTDQQSWNLNCDSGNDTILVNDNGGDNYPTLYFQFEADDNGDQTNNTYTLLYNGNPFYSSTVNNGQRSTISFISPGLPIGGTYSVDVSNPDGTTTWDIYDINGTDYGGSSVTNASVTNQTSCQMGGTITWDISPAVAGLYYWDSGKAYVNPNELGTGNFTVTYIYDNGGPTGYQCTSTASHLVTIVNPYSPDWTAPAAVCPEAADINLSALITGNTGGTWSGTGVTGTNFDPSVGTQSITYTYNASGTGCDTSQTHTITVFAPANADAGADDDLCIGQTTAQLNASGGTSYVWTPTTSLSDANISNPVVTIASDQTYTVEVTDVNGCKDTDDVLVVANTPPTAVAGGSDVCVGDALAITSTPNSMTSYDWTGPDSYTSGTQNPTVSASATTAMSGDYTIIVTDANGCTGTDDVTITVNPNPTPTIAGNLTICASNTEIYSVTNVSGNTYNWSVTGGTITSGAGTNSITVNWGTVTTGNVEITETTSSSCSETVSEAITINPIPTVTANSSDANNAICLGDSLFLYGSGTADTYTWDNGVVDNNYFSPTTTISYIVTGELTTTGCLTTDTIEITVNPNPTIDDVAVTEVTNCPNPDGTIGITVSGGTPSYQYSIDAGNTLNANNIFSGLNGGVYSIYIEDINGCSDTTTATVINSSAPDIDSVAITEPLCNGYNTGEIIIYSAGATTYSIDNGTNTQTDNVFTGLVAGTYQIWIADAGMCQTVGSATINEPTAIELDSAVTPAICGSTGTAQVIVTGGTPDYTYTWDYNSETSNSISNLPAGTYICDVLDNNSCPESITIIVPDGGGIPDVIITNHQDVLCNGESTGSITAILNNNNSPFTYTWSHNTSLNDSIANNLSIGTYYVTISDVYGCSDNDTIVITEPGELDVIISDYKNPNCNDETTGYISVSATGGTPGYSYNWSNGSISQNLNDIGAGNYILVVTDNNSCKETVSQELINPTDILLSDNISYDNYYGNIQVTVTGGTPDYAYLWSNNETTSSISNLLTGNYFITVTDANGCTVNNSYEIKIDLIIPSVITPNADGKNDKFRITNIESKKNININIFNRWGDLIFTYEDSGAGYPAKEWDGTDLSGHELPIGSYVYVIDINGGEITEKGTVTIVR